MRQLRGVITVLGVLGTAAAAAGVAAHYLGVVDDTVARIAAFTPVLVVLGAVAVLLLALTRRWALVALALVVVGAGVWSQVPLFTGSAPGPNAGGATIRLMQANIRLGEADAAALVRTVTDERVDVLTLVELTEKGAQRLLAAGLTDVLPCYVARPRDSGGGAAILSRFPLSAGTRLAGLETNNLQAVAQLPGVGPIAVYALHPVPPYPGPAEEWATELRRLQTIFAAQDLPVLVGADFNSTYDHRQYRDLLRESSLVDAAEYLGAGLVATFPADQWYPAVLGIDKILTRGGTPQSLRRVDLPGSDHYGVIGDVRFGAS
ncbi:MAG: endonuclease/exonuclease/phosphatase family protein [Mycobacterium sp.]|nr:endonuclease/exonuclease/phosphatase family protein [Mycobacterium sp.]